MAKASLRPRRGMAMAATACAVCASAPLHLAGKLRLNRRRALARRSNLRSLCIADIAIDKDQGGSKWQEIQLPRRFKAKANHDIFSETNRQPYSFLRQK